MIANLLLFLLPTQLALHFWPSWAFVFGIRVDFLAPAVYLTDILCLILIFANLRVYRKYLKYLLALLIFAVVNIFFSTSPPESVYKWIKIFEMVGIGIHFAKSNAGTTKIFKILFYSAVLVSLVGIFQFVLGRNIGGVLYLLGERSFRIGTPGIALVQFSGQNFLRAYSTFSHPNSLAGYLGVILILFLDFKKKNIYEYLGAFPIALGFVLTFSLTAFVGLAVVLLLKYVITEKKVFTKLSYIILFSSFIFSLLLPVFAKRISLSNLGLEENLSQRFDLSYLSGKMITEKFLIGEGLNTFIVNIPRFRSTFSFSWLLQPVHNVPLLVFSETGIIGLITLFIVFYKLLKASLKENTLTITMIILFVVVTWVMDHYWFTLQQNILLVSILLGLSARIEEWKNI